MKYIRLTPMTPPPFSRSAYELKHRDFEIKLHFLTEVNYVMKRMKTADTENTYQKITIL